ncbi:MAG: hypothetical protein PT118_18475 [Aphanizomenon gracile PMC644.10]|nr:hypothetical protein [Aphanizomenon gracile PMC644.10]
MIQEYIDKINAHTWTNDKLKSALVLATYVNCGLIEFSRSVGQELPIDVELIIDNLINADKANLG